VYSTQCVLHSYEESKALTWGYEALQSSPEFLDVGFLKYWTSKGGCVYAVRIVGVDIVGNLVQGIQYHGEVGRQRPGFLVMVEHKLEKLGGRF
jgi:hypothetical protein